MNKTRIEWADYTWNPIKGLCPEGCSYCYGRRLYQRFGWPAKLSYSSGLIGRYGIPPSGSKIFACSTMELFHQDIPKAWRDWVFEDIESHPDLTFIILTKRPERIDRPMPPNVWLGVSVTGLEDWWRVSQLRRLRPAAVKFISLEPFMGIRPSKIAGIDWLIVGRMTGHGHYYDPDPEDLVWLRREAYMEGIPLFLKNNLSGIWPGPLIQEFPIARASSNGRTSAFQADDPGSSPGARSINPKGGKA